MRRPLRVVFVAPAYWPATAFGGPIPVMRALAAGLVANGHRVDVVTTGLRAIGARPAFRTVIDVVDGACVRYLATPLWFRWMGIAPATARTLARLPRPDVVHIFGFRDVVGTHAAAWCRRHDVPYVFEGLGMVRPKLRKVALKRVLDRTIYRGVLRGAAIAVAASSRERDEYLEAGIPSARIAIRPNGVAPVDARAAGGSLRRRLPIPDGAPIVLSVGRVAAGKGLELLVRTVAAIPHAHGAIVGPDDGHGTTAELLRLRRALGAADRVHLVGAVAPADLGGIYRDADVFVLASAHENFGLVAASAASAGLPVVVTDRCGVAEFLGDGVVVVPYEQTAIEDAVRSLLADSRTRRELGAAGRRAAATLAWPRIVALQVDLYDRVARQ